ncbi:hypothetical protein PACTADRAFT_34122 [Pachysolen tannophilus NRRL Y-2460]|uniref:CMP/dCMP-type deaminase domain-containing protein n=1 Tax=Pachysolen tannophilus NRRL Y-2460 TaxID=669874 RepID=A0A1E4TV77_PACTA|nr:hypothetical protein PACTADRAFT_34122 [Pachysolen tannophilus NRRL Y-2460]
MSSTVNIFPERSPLPSRELMIKHLRTAIKTANRAKTLLHKHPFGCILVGPDNEEVLISQGNIDTLNHAESTLCRIAWSNFPPEFLWKCTLYTNFEPCVMCFGSCYWSNIGRIVYGAEEQKLLQLTNDNPENMTLNLDSRSVAARGQKDIQIIGPFDELFEEIIKDHKDFWNH